MKVKRVNKMPETGQFVSVWIYDERIWSRTYKWLDGTLLSYNPWADEWEEDMLTFLPDDYIIKYYVTEEK